MSRRVVGFLPVIIVWSVVAAVNGFQNLLRAELGGHSVTLRHAFSQNLIFLAIWALGTPLILASARRFPIRQHNAFKHGALHVLLGTLFVLFLNAAGISAVAVFEDSGFDPDAVAGATAQAFVQLYHIAIIVYLVVVAAGHVSWRQKRRRGPSATLLSEDSSRAIESAPETAADTAGGMDRITIRKNRSTHVLPAERVDWIEASGDHVIFHAGRERHRVRGSLKALYGRLDQRRFVRIHRSVIVNVSRVANVRSYNYGDLTVLLTTGRQLRVSRTRRRDLERALGQRS